MAKGLGKIALVVLLGLVIAGLWPGAEVAQAADPLYHTVRRGETLSYISRLYGVSVWQIAQANGIWNPNVIYVGQTLYIPPGGPYYAPRTYWHYAPSGPYYYSCYYYPCYYPYYYYPCYYRYPCYYPCYYRYPCYYDP